MRCNMFWRASLEASFSGVMNRILMDATVEEKDIAESFLKTALLSSEDWMEDRKATGERWLVKKSTDLELDRSEVKY